MDLKDRRQSTCCAPATRTWYSVAKGTDENGEEVSGFKTFEEVVYQHDIYLTEGRKFWRGAEIRG